MSDLREGNPLPRTQAKARLRACETAAAESMSLSDTARLLGITLQGLTQWLRDNDKQDLRDRLRANGRPGCMPVAAMEARLQAVKTRRAEGWPDLAIAQEIGICRSGLSKWLRVNAPFGVDDALDLLTDSDIAIQQ